jgi:predicted site-specific integrase-resolvase
MIREMLSGEVARYLNVHPITITRMAEAGRLKFRLNQHGWKVFKSDEVEQMAKKRSQQKETK